MTTPFTESSSLQRAISFSNFHSASTLTTQAEAALLRPNPTLEHALSNSTAKGLPPISVLPLEGQYLSILAQATGAKSILEVGTLGGYSTICLAETGAKVTSIEIDPKHRDVALENVKGLDVEVLLGAALDVMPSLVKEGRLFDMVFIDADLADQWEQFDLAVRLTRVGGCVFLDDVVTTLFKDEQVGEGKVDTILTRIGADERVKATLVPTVKTHPMVPHPVFGGFVFALVKGH